MRTTWTLIASLALVLCVAACSKREHPIDGIGDFKLGKSTLGQWGYRCNPPENGKTFCLANPRAPTHFIKLGEQNAQANALFDGTTDEAPLLEIELLVDKCNAKSLRSWLKSEFGDPSSERADKAFWEQSIVFISAKVDESDPECSVLFVEKKRADRVAELKRPK